CAGVAPLAIEGSLGTLSAAPAPEARDLHELLPHLSAESRSQHAPDAWRLPRRCRDDGEARAERIDDRRVSDDAQCPRPRLFEDEGDANHHGTSRTHGGVAVAPRLW